MSDPVAVPPRSRDAVRQAWVERLARFAVGGLPTAQFCAAEGVSLASFYLWKRRLAKTPADSPGPDEAPRLLPVRLGSAPAPLELVLPGGTVLRVAAGADPVTLATLLRLLGVSPC
jgi:hypothetical protein